MTIFTIGFTKKSAETFFTLLRTPGIRRVADIRLNNSSQLAGFAKRDDLRFFAREVCGIDYVHIPELAPTQDILDDYKKTKNGDWDLYERQFLTLMAERRVERTVSRDLMDGACLLCSEHTPDQCHRRLVAEYLREKWTDVDVHHLV
jgi:uncharacterized protein (DUF488 family)